MDATKVVLSAPPKLVAVPNERWYRALKVLATITGVAGAALTAIGSHSVFAGFAFFLVSSMIWIGVAWRQREISLLILQLCFAAIDIIGMWRWW